MLPIGCTTARLGGINSQGVGGNLFSEGNQLINLFPLLVQGWAEPLALGSIIPGFHAITLGRVYLEKPGKCWKWGKKQKEGDDLGGLGGIELLAVQCERTERSL